MKSGFSIRTAIFSTVLAMALWTLVSLRSSYDVVASVPLEFVLPENRSIEVDVPRDIRLKLHGSGWHLVNLLYLNPNSRCVIDLGVHANTSTVITSQDIQTGFRTSVPATVVEVLSSPFTVQLGIVTEKVVPLISSLALKCAPGFIQVGEPVFFPDSIRLRGNVKLLDGVHSWRTQSLHLDNIRETQSGMVSLSDSLSSIVRIEPQTVRYSVDVQRSAELRLDDIPVVINGAPAQTNHVCEPTTISLVLRGGVDEIDQLNRDDIHVSIEYSKLLHDTTGALSPEIRLPGHLHLLSTQPAQLVHTVRPASEGSTSRVNNSRHN